MNMATIPKHLAEQFTGACIHCGHSKGHHSSGRCFKDPNVPILQRRLLGTYYEEAPAPKVSLKACTDAESPSEDSTRTKKGPKT